jgi:diguanylate cyclase (GGDEF)-like protein
VYAEPTLSPATARRTQVVLLLVWLTTAVLILMLAGLLYKAKEDAEQRTAEEVATVARMAANRVALTFEGTDGVLNAIQADLRSVADNSNGIEQLDRAAMTTLLTRSVAWSPGLVSLALVDSRGHFVANSAADGSADSMSGSIDGSSYFSLLSQASGPRVISGAMADPLTRTWGISLARVMRNTDGTFQGALIAHIEIGKSFARFGRGLTDGSTDLLVLRQADGTLLAEYPANGDVLASDHDLAAAIQRTGYAGVSHSEAALDGKTRLVAIHKLPAYGFQVIYGRDIEGPLTTWRWDMLVALLVALLGIASSTAITLSIRRMTVMTNQLETVRGHLKQSNRSLREALAASELIAAKDQLTGLWNRRTFDLRLDQAVARRQRHQGTFSLLLIDMDHFKAVNDAYGHAVGDDVLRQFAQVLHERLRQNDVDARWGGEEFAVLADGAGLEDAFTLAEQIREAVETTVFGGVPRLTISIGLAEHQPGESREQLFGRADQALYEGKRRGRNCVLAASHHSVTLEYFSTGPCGAELFAETTAESQS